MNFLSKPFVPQFYDIHHKINVKKEILENNQPKSPKLYFISLCSWTVSIHLFEFFSMVFALFTI